MPRTRDNVPSADTAIVIAKPPPRRRAVAGHSIATYRERRDFAVTAEPPPSEAPLPGRDAPLFVVQKHHASRLHWDFRLEHGGVLWSWAVPRGPSLDPHDKRLAVHVEDHPVDYANFHGSIPEGQYGAGTVETWDRGTWEPVDDAATALESGQLKFVLSGKRLHGKFVLIRLKPRPKERAENWLLIKEHDSHERAGMDATAIESAIAPPKPKGAKRVYGKTKRPAASKTAGAEEIDGVRVTHPERPLWPGITKHDLAEYWRAVAPFALPEIAGRPLALVRCPEGFAGEHFFQKHGKPGFPSQIRAGVADGAPYLSIDDEPGLIAAAQVSAIELHAWGASGQDPLHPDRLVFDLDPGDGVTIADIVAAARDVRERLAARGLGAFCRTSGGKGLHVVAPLVPHADWTTARAWCRAFAEAMEAKSPDRYVASVPKARRSGRILVDWLRNGLGSTAIASFSPRAREGAGVATRLAWDEVTEKLDPAGFNLRTVPQRLERQQRDAWDGFGDTAAKLPDDLAKGRKS